MTEEKRKPIEERLDLILSNLRPKERAIVEARLAAGPPSPAADLAVAEAARRDAEFAETHAGKAFEEYRRQQPAHVMVYGCPVPPEDADAIREKHTPAHVDPSPTIPPQAHDELGPVAELRPDGQGGRAPAGTRRPRVRVEVLAAACAMQGWTLRQSGTGAFFSIHHPDGGYMTYHADREPSGMVAEGSFDEVLDMIAVVAAAAIGK